MTVLGRFIQQPADVLDSWSIWRRGWPTAGT